MDYTTQKNTMRKKAFLVILAVAILGLVPLNNQLIFGYGSDGRSDGGSSSPIPSCNGTRPGKPTLFQPGHSLLSKATGVGEVRLNWLRTQNASSYGVGVGLTPGNYIYGSPNVGDTTNFTVRFLTPGKIYYFAVRANNGCTPGPWSQEWSFTTGGGSLSSNFQGNNNTGNQLRNNSGSFLPVVTPTRSQRFFGTTPQPTNTNISQPTTTPQAGGLPVYTPPLPSPTPQPGFFQGIWKGFVGIFGQ